MQPHELAAVLRVRADQMWGSRFADGPITERMRTEDMIRSTLISLAEDLEEIGGSGDKAYLRIMKEAAKLRKEQ